MSLWDVLTTPDFFTPILAWMQPGADLWITDAPGRTAWQVIALLQQNGVRCSRIGSQVTDDAVIVRVNNLKRAVRVLKENGVEAF